MSRTSLLTVPPLIEIQLVLVIFIIWAVVLMLALHRKSPPLLRLLLLLPLVLLTRNPFGSVLKGTFFLVGAWGVQLMFLSPFWWSRHAMLVGAAAFVGLLSDILAIAVPSLLKRAFPERRSLGIILAVIYGPWGHWYLEGGGFWVVGVWGAAFLSGLAYQLAWISWPGANVARPLALPQLWLGWPGATLHLASGLTMYVRFIRRSEPFPNFVDITAGGHID